MTRTWRDALGVYRDTRLVAIFAMGVSSGLPLLLTTSTLSYWLARSGVDKTAIGLFALVGLPYSLKVLWAPVLDQVALPVLGRLGRRRSWILLLQAALVLAIASLGSADPAAAPLATAAVVVVLAFLSATQDVAIDAYRIEILEDHEQGAGAAATQAGYRVGMLIAGAGAIALADSLAWEQVFRTLALVLGVSMFFVVAAPEPERHPRADFVQQESRFERAFIAPLRDLAARPRWGVVLVFAVVYKLGEAIAGAMMNPLFVDLGFSGVEIASVTKVLGLAATVVGIGVGGVLVARTAVIPALALGGVLQAVTNLLFAWLASVGHHTSALAIAVVSDSFTGGVASAAFVAYFSSLCRGKFSATQYALLTSLMATGRTFFAGGSGWLATQTDWATFFIATTVLALPGLALLLVLPDPRHSAALEPPVRST